MSNKNGFTLMEIIVVLVIICILTIIALPIYFNTIQQAQLQNAANNLDAIASAQQTYFFKTGTYCYPTGPGNTNCTTLSSIDSILGLNLFDNNFTYTCGAGGVGSNYSCSVVDNNTFAIQLNYIATPSPSKYCFGNATCPSGWTKH